MHGKATGRPLGAHGLRLQFLRIHGKLTTMMKHSTSILEKANGEVAGNVDRAAGTLSELTIDELSLLLISRSTLSGETGKYLDVDK